MVYNRWLELSSNLFDLPKEYSVLQWVSSKKDWLLGGM